MSFKFKGISDLVCPICNNKLQAFITNNKTEAHICDKDNVEHIYKIYNTSEQFTEYFAVENMHVWHSMKNNECFTTITISPKQIDLTGYYIDPSDQNLIKNIKKLLLLL